MDIKGYHTSSSFICNSSGVINKDDWLGFLFKNTVGTIPVFYHLDYSTAQILRHLQINEFQLRKLFETGSLYAAPWTIRYRKGKFLNITYGFGKAAPYVSISDVHQYHHRSNLTELEPIEYAKEAQRIGEQVYSVLVSLDLKPTSLVSPIRAWEKDVLRKLDLPTIADIPEEAGEFAYNCLEGPWVEAFQIGYFEHTWDYDIKSAYGSKTAQLLDTRYGKWYHQPEYIDDAYYAYCKCCVNIGKDFSPIFHRVQDSHGDEKNMMLVGKHPEKFLNKAKIDHLDEFDLGTCEILDGYWWVPEKELVYPYMQMIDELHEIKENMKDELSREVIKRIINGVWGKSGQENMDGFGDLFFSPWAVETESGITVNVAEFVLNNELYPDYLLHIITDGILSSAPVNLPNTNGIGSWKLTYNSAAFVIGSGTCLIDGKSGEGDFALSYDWLMKQVKKSPYSKRYYLKSLSPLTLGKAIKNSKVDMLGDFEEIAETVDITYEDKRCYPDRPINGKELLSGKYKSEPWGVDFIGSVIR